MCGYSITMLLDRLHIGYFLGAFAIGILFVYLSTPDPHVVVKFPSPYNQDVVYKDTSNTCYKYHADATTCPVDTSKIKAQPIVEDYAASGENPDSSVDAEY
jgi:hypothetical protein